MIAIFKVRIVKVLLVVFYYVGKRNVAPDSKRISIRVFFIFFLSLISYVMRRVYLFPFQRTINIFLQAWRVKLTVKGQRQEPPYIARDCG